MTDEERILTQAMVRQAYEQGMANPRGCAIAPKGKPLIGWSAWLKAQVDKAIDEVETIST